MLWAVGFRQQVLHLLGSLLLAAALHCLLELGLAGAHSYVRADLSKLIPDHSLSGIRVLWWLKIVTRWAYVSRQSTYTGACKRMTYRSQVCASDSSSVMLMELRLYQEVDRSIPFIKTPSRCLLSVTVPHSNVTQLFTIGFFAYA